MKIGYARVSTDEQNLDFQLEALSALSPSDVLVVWKLDRLGRSLIHLVSLLGELGQNGVGSASVTESIDTTTAGGRLLFHMMGALAEFERSLIVERTKAGMSAARRRGKHLGRPAKLTAEHLAHARRLIDAGAHTRRSIAALLGVDESTLRRALNKR